MRRPYVIAILAGSIAAPILFAACADIFQIKGGWSVDGGEGGAGDAAVDVPFDYVTFDAISYDVNTAICDGGVMTVAADSAMWVTRNGSDMGNSTCTQAMPCRTIGHALTVQFKNHIYLDDEIFEEALSLDGSYMGWTIQGGWVLDAGVWTEQCDSRLTTIKGPDDGGSSAVDLVGASGITFRLLQIYSKVQGTPGQGESVYAMRVMDTNGVTLDNVSLVAQSGSQGLVGNGGAPGGGCDMGTGSGTMGNTGMAGPTGTWGNSGYTPQAAGSGGSGNQGTSNSGAAGACGSCTCQ